MIAMTRSASMTPPSTSSTRPEASLTFLIGTLRTSMGSGTAGSPFLFYDDRTGGAGHRVGDPVQRGDHGALATGLHEPARGVDLGAHGSAGELPVGGQAAQPFRGHVVERRRPV